MPTATQIIENALGEIGSKAPGEPVAGSELQDCFDRLNAMIDGWRAQTLYATHETTVTATLPALSTQALIGTGQLFNAERPVAILAGSSFTLSGLSYPVTPIPFAQYQGIGLKTQTAPGPTVLYYQATVPNGTVFFWPAPSSSVSVTLAISQRMSQFPDLTTNLTLAPGAYRALFLSLAEELLGPYQADAPVTLARNASGARRVLKRSNTVVETMSLPGAIMGGRSGGSLNGNW